MEDFTCYETKLKKILLKFSGSNFVIPNNYDIEKLLSFLSDKDTQEIRTICYEWVRDTLSDKHYFLHSISNSVKTFIVRLMAFLSKDCTTLQKMFFNGIIDFVFEYINNESYNNHSLKLAFIDISLVMCKHFKTIEWLLDKNVWRFVLKIYKENNTVYVTKSAAKFITTLIWELNDRGDEHNCSLILDEIIQPICEHPWKDMQVINSDENNDMDRLLSPVFVLLVDIIGHPKRFGKGSIIARYLNGGSSVSWFMLSLVFICTNENVMWNLAKANFVSVFTKVNMFKKDEDMTDSDILKCNLFFVNMVNVLITKQYLDIILEFSMYCHRYLNSVSSYLPPESVTKKKLEPLRLIFIVIPVLSILSTIENIRNNDQEILNLFLNKIFEISNEQGIRVGYMFWDLIKGGGNCEMMAIKSIHNLMSPINTITLYEANIIFQTLFYKLKEVVQGTAEASSDNSVQNDMFESPQSTRLLCSILDALHWVIDKYDICWQESVEIISVYQITTNLISMRNLGTNGTFKALRLVKLTIEKFLPPNIALLIDSPNESNMNQIGKNIYNKLHDLNWEVRDSTLEVLLTCTKIALIKYTPLQNQIVDHNLGSITVMVAMNDSESYVRASAFRCLNEMANIQTIWDQCLASYPNLHMDLLKLLHVETEGLIRKEVVGVLTSLFKHKNLPDHLHDYLLQSMSYSATEDLYWEVQLAALYFWKIYIVCLLTNQGMIDGKFPSVTFSKETRKIVTLNTGEIVKRLKKVLQELSTKGCLAVLLYCLTPDNVDVEIMEFSYSVVSDLKLLLDEYEMGHDFSSQIKVKAGDVDLIETKREIKCDGDIIKSEYCHIDDEKSNTVIESILNADDLSLLAGVYHNQITVKHESEEGDATRSNLSLNKSKKPIVDPEVFIKNIYSTDYNAMIEEKKSWISGNTNFHSLLDDILGEYHCTDVNNMDCY